MVEEQLKVGKRRVERGGVRIRSYVTERLAEADVALREEKVHVERHPVDRPATAADLAAGERVIEATETVEEPVIAKEQGWLRKSLSARRRRSARNMFPIPFGAPRWRSNTRRES